MWEFHENFVEFVVPRWIPEIYSGKCRNFHFSTIKIFVLIISGKIPKVIIKQLADAIFDKENYFLAIMSRISKVNL